MEYFEVLIKILGQWDSYHIANGNDLFKLIYRMIFSTKVHKIPCMKN